MKAAIQFTKMHGAGNDYIYVDTQRFPIADPATAARAWSRPHFGIGSDGLVLIGAPADAAKADFSMRIFNADGSEAMMCGNASRCIGKYVYERGLTSKRVVRLETLSGVKTLHLDVDATGTAVRSVTVDMLAAAYANPAQFVADKAPVLDGMAGTFVSMGNPHYVFFVADAERVDVAALGRRFEHDAAFPEACNIEFASPLAPGRLRMRVWERGSGITLACGTGACATAAAALYKGIAREAVEIVMDGGTLSIARRDDGHIMMTGPAEFVFDGTILINE